MTVRYKIEKNTVQETLIIPLYARKKNAQSCAQVCTGMRQRGNL